ncbi:MAG: pyridoxal phosphate-dependent aminotransferase [Alphaproteobacteria bacterium]
MKRSRRSEIPPFYAMEVLQRANERAAAGDDVLHLEIGEPSRRPPKRVIEAAEEALRNRPLGYTESAGLPELRARITQHYEDFYGLSVPFDRVLVTTGSSNAFLLTFLSAFDVGDRVALASPGYPGYRNGMAALGIRVVDLPAGPNSRFHPSVELIEACGEKLDGLIIASPSNPAGSMLLEDDFKTLVSYCISNDIRIISDEVYHGITYGERAVCARALTEEAVVVNSFSKYFAMTGWRLGWMIAPDDLTEPAERLAQNMFISPPGMTQYAALAAFECLDEYDAEVHRYAENRAILLEELPKAGIERFAPADGAFYLYADVSELTDDSSVFCEAMLAETGVAAAPGIDFDPKGGKSYVRFSFAGSTEDIGEAARRIVAWRRKRG